MVVFNINTEGVLFVCSSEKLLKRYEKEEFSYDFPSNILTARESHELFAIKIISGNEVRVQVSQEDNNDVQEKYNDWENISCFSLVLEDTDKMIFLSHSEFTQVCSRFNGDINKFTHLEPIRIIEGLESGYYTVEVYARELDFDEVEVFSELTFILKKEILSSNLFSMNHEIPYF